MRCKTILFLSLLLQPLFIAGCNLDSSDPLILNHVVNNVGDVPLSDLVHISFRIKNRSVETIMVKLIHECDCTTISKENVVLAPHYKVRIDAHVIFDRVGDFQKYIFVYTDRLLYSTLFKSEVRQ